MSSSREYAFKRLSRRSFYSEELKHELIKGGYEDAESVVLSLIEEGYLNDQEWMDSFIRGAVRRGNSPLEVRGKLFTRRVKPSDVEYILQELKKHEGQVIEKLMLKTGMTKEKLYRKGFSVKSLELENN